MKIKSRDYGLLYTENPPYEVLATKWLPFEDVPFNGGNILKTHLFINRRQTIAAPEGTPSGGFKKAIKESRRIMDVDKLEAAVKRLHAGKNIHIHLDLIAGLPFEDYESFRNSFNRVYAMKPEQLQLGFLKVLSGSYMEEKSRDYGLPLSCSLMNFHISIA